MAKTLRMTANGGLLLALVAAGVWLLGGCSDAERGDARERGDAIETIASTGNGASTGKGVVERGDAIETIASTGKGASDGKGAAERGDAPVLDAWVEELPEADRPLGQAIVDAGDKEDLAALGKLIDDVRKSKNAAVRLRMVEALGWFGKDAVVELSRFLADTDEEVARSAFSEWDSAVDQVDDEKFGVAASVSAMKVLTNEDDLSCAVCRIESADDRKAAIKALIELTECGNPPAVAAAKEAYEFITGDEWTDATTAAAKAETINDEE